MNEYMYSETSVIHTLIIQYTLMIYNMVVSLLSQPASQLAIPCMKLATLDNPMTSTQYFLKWVSEFR